MKLEKPLWRISIATTLEAEDAVGEMLARVFECAASAYYDFERKRSLVTVFVRQKAGRNIRHLLRENLKGIKSAGLDTGEATISISRVKSRDWAESWKRHFRAIEISDALLVKPGWIKKKPRKNQAVVILDPGLSFGTGQHPTTEYCLREIVRYAPDRTELQEAVSQSLADSASDKLALTPTLSPRRGRIIHRRFETASNSHGPGNEKAGLPTKSFLDIGAGSGILAIAAAKLGYHPVCAIDFDRDAVRIARSNAHANAAAIQVVQGDAARLPRRPKNKFDFICANLISGLLVKQRERIIAQLNPSGRLILAGILRAEFPMVQREFEEAGLKLISAKSENEWRSGSFCFA